MNKKQHLHIPPTSQEGQILIETLISLISLITLILLSIKGIKNAYKLNKKYQYPIYQKNKISAPLKKAKYYV